MGLRALPSSMTGVAMMFHSMTSDGMSLLNLYVRWGRKSSRMPIDVALWTTGVIDKEFREFFIGNATSVWHAIAL